MPFVLRLLGDRDGEQLYSIEAGNVERESDRIALIDEEEVTALFLLDQVDDLSLLRVDWKHSDAAFVEALQKNLRENAGIENPGETNVWLFTGVLDTGELMLEVPPTLAIKVGDKWLLEEPDDDDEEDEGKDVSRPFRVEARTINI